MMRKMMTLTCCLLVLCLLAGCASKSTDESQASAQAMQQQTQSAIEQAVESKQEETQEAEIETEIEEEVPDQEIVPDDVAGADAGVTSNAQDWIDLLCAHPWKAIDDLPDYGEWVSIYTFDSDGTFTYFGGWNASEADADYAGHYEVSEDGVLTLVYTSGHQAEITYRLGFNIDTITFTQVGDEGLMYFHEAGCTTTLSAA